MDNNHDLTPEQNQRRIAFLKCADERSTQIKTLLEIDKTPTLLLVECSALTAIFPYVTSCVDSGQMRIDTAFTLMEVIDRLAGECLKERIMQLSN
jgi:hypothetical protein